MDNGAPAIPGFRSLAQAGIHLGDEGENQQERETATDGASPASKARRAQSVAVQPREPGTKRPLPHDRSSGTLPGGVVPNGLYVGQLPPLEFSCPSCGVVLTITDPGSYNGKPGPCPHCSAVVLPPRVVSPFAMVGNGHGAQRPSEDSPRHYSGFSL